MGWMERVMVGWVVAADREKKPNGMDGRVLNGYDAHKYPQLRINECSN